jgi:hypothetical protein
MSTLSVSNIIGVADQTVADLESTGTLTANAVVFTANATFNDNAYAIFGSPGNDLQIYHDGTNSYINDQGTGDLRLESSFIKLTAGDEARVYVKYAATQFLGAIEEEVYTLSGTSVALDPFNGTIQTHTLTGSTTYTDSLNAGESMTLMIDDGTAYTITWPTTTWVNNGGSAPTLATTGYTVVALWKVSTTLYGALVGDGS